MRDRKLDIIVTVGFLILGTVGLEFDTSSYFSETLGYFRLGDTLCHGGVKCFPLLQYLFFYVLTRKHTCAYNTVQIVLI